MLFARKPLRADIGAEILGRIIDGRLPSGTRINESHLAVDLGISRTPLREAMLCLATAGALDADMGRGFSVPHFTGREIAEVLATLAVLLSAATRQSGEFALKDQVEARNVLGRIRLQIDQPPAFCEHFYRLLGLIAGQCPNRVLGGECERLAQLLLRYLHEALARGWNPDPSLTGLQESLQVLQQGDRPTAAAMIERALTQMSADLAARFPAAVAART